MTVIAQAAQQSDHTTFLIWVGVIAVCAAVRMLFALEARA